MKVTQLPGRLANRLRPTLAAASAIGALIAAFALSACGPRDDAALAANAAAAVPTQSAPATVVPATSDVPPQPLVATSGEPAPLPQAGNPGYARQPQNVPQVPDAGYAPAPQSRPVPVARQAETVAEAQPVARGHIGSIESIEPIHERPQGSGAGAVIGGVLGAVVGNQFGHGTGRAAMTGLGAVGGAVAGNNVERNTKERVIGYRVNIRLDDGQTRTFERTQVGDLHVGDRVRVDSGTFHRV